MFFYIYTKEWADKTSLYLQFFLSYNIETKVGKIESATFKSHPQHIWFYKYQFKIGLFNKMFGFTTRLK